MVNVSGHSHSHGTGRTAHAEELTAVGPLVWKLVHDAATAADAQP